MQLLLKTTGTKADNEIPVPPPQESDINYDELYRIPWRDPNTYIRFSQTVEECVGCAYDMTEEDDVFLKAYNAKRPPAQQLSEDDFESVMDVFEETASFSTPFAAVDKTVAPYSEMVPGLMNLDSDTVMPHAKELYEYWKQRRQAEGNGPLHPTLKFETHQDSDDMDPYVCFRRREVRQTRKTRARDVQSADKLKRLRRELEDGRSLVLQSYERELNKRDLLQMDKAVYETRASLKEMKVRLGIKTNDDDLWKKVCQTDSSCRWWPTLIANIVPRRTCRRRVRGLKLRMVRRHREPRPPGPSALGYHGLVVRQSKSTCPCWKQRWLCVMKNCEEIS